MASFPSTGLISGFQGPDENPISEDGRWQQTREFGGLARPPLKKVGNAVTDSIHGDPNYSSWVAQTFYADLNGNVAEVWGCSSGGQLGAALETWRVALFSTLGLVNGYQLYYGGGIGKGFALWRYDNSNFFPIAASGGGYPSGLGLRIVGTEIEGWASYGDPFDRSSWSLQLSTTDATHRGYFYASLGIEDPTAGGLSFGCFGGGIIHRTQFFRWLHN